MCHALTRHLSRRLQRFEPKIRSPYDRSTSKLHTFLRHRQQPVRDDEVTIRELWVSSSCLAHKTIN